MKLHALVVKVGFDDVLFVKTNFLGLYMKCGYLENAHKVFDDIPEKNIFSWTTIISGYIDLGQCVEVLCFGDRLRWVLSLMDITLFGFCLYVLNREV